MEPLRLELLGGFAVRRGDGDSCPLPARKARALLAYMAVPPGRSHSREKLTALLWGDTPDSLARQAFRQSLSRLRRGLGDAQSAIVDSGDTVALDAANVWVDVVEFEAAAASDTQAALERAAVLYRGDLLDGLDLDEAPFEEWWTTERERLRELALEALTKLLRHHMRASESERAVQTALRILALDPMQEAVHRALMRLYVTQGRRAAALRQYQECVQSLQRELGVEPEEATRALYRDVLRGTAEADPARTRTTSPRAAGLRAAGPASLGPLVGRADELAALERSLESALDGGGRVAVVSGEAGVGKTRLLDALGDVAGRRGVRVALGRCYETEQPLPFRPWVDALRGDLSALDSSSLGRLTAGSRAQLARLFPELPHAGDHPGVLADDHGALFEALRELLAQLAADGPLFVALEDVHWADPMSVRFLAFLGRRMGSLPVLVVATARSEETADAAILARVIAELRDARLLDHVALGALSVQDSLTLARALHGGGDPAVIERAADALWSVSEGNPFVIVETVRMLRDASGAANPGVVPPSVRDAVGQRLARLSASAQTVATAVAVIGRPASFDVLRAASGLAEAEAAAAVEELVRRRVLDASGERLDFAHERIRRVAYDAILPHRRALLHEAVGAALEATARADVEDVVDEIASHFLRAGRGDRAYPYLLRFSTLAQLRYDIEVARAALRRAATAAEALSPSGRDRARVEVGLRDAGLLLLSGQPLASLEVLHALQALCERVNDIPLMAEYYFGTSMAHFFLGQYAEALASAKRGLVESERTAVDERIGAALFALGISSLVLGDSRSAVSHATRALALFDRAHVGHWQAHAYWLLAQSQVLRGDLVDAVANAERAATAADMAGVTPLRSFATTAIAWVHASRGEGAAAVARASEALGQARVPLPMVAAMRTLGHAHVEAGDADAAIAVLERLLGVVFAKHPFVHALVCLAEAYRMKGDTERAAKTAREAIELASAAGNLFNLGLAQRALARSTANGAEARVMLEGALAAFVESDAAFEAALTRLDLARIHAEDGDPTRAAAHLAAAIAVFDVAAAPVRVAQARELACAFGLDLGAALPR